MTWAEFKAAVEAAGVRDDDEIDWIDISSPESIHVVIAEASSRGNRNFSVSEG